MIIARWIRRGAIAIGVAAILFGVLLGIRYWPRAPLSSRIPTSVAIFDVHGELMRLTTASDEQYRVWTPLKEISPQLVDALLLHEDQHFYRHFGVNPIALLRAATSTYSGSARLGGSTLTMQLAREMNHLNTRSASGKLRQIGSAIALEVCYSKRDILEAHLNLMPYGGNVQGVGTASLIYFGKPASRLSLQEALSLVLIPQSPLRRDPKAAEPENLRAARDRLFARWSKLHPEAEHDRTWISEPLNYASLGQLPFNAPHFTGFIIDRHARDSALRTVHTTLDLNVQKLSERVVTSYVREQSRIGIHNAAILLADSRDLSVRALVGSVDFYADDISGQVNGALAKRSPGSALKPFVYALALDQGLIHPLTILKDAPTNFGGFSPENFDGRFAGPISATEALTRSRNVPAVTLASRLAEPSFYQFLRSAGIGKLASEQHYGLALALGGGEVTMEEMVTLYAMLANRGKLAPLRYEETDARVAGSRLLSEEASFVTLDMLAGAPRPDVNIWSTNVAQRTRTPVAWKTGTSWGFRDAWTVGVVGPYVLAVWVGNFDGSGNPAFVGVQAAAPLFFRLVDALAAREPDLRAPNNTIPRRLARVEVCVPTGELPNADCPQTTKTWFIPGVSPIGVSQVHRRVTVDIRTGKQACPPYDAQFTRTEIFEYWPSDMQRLFAQAGMPRRDPPSRSDCENGPAPELTTDTPPKISSPAARVTYAVRAKSDADSIPLQASAASGVRRLHWFIDDVYAGSVNPDESLAWRTQRDGRHIVRAVDDRGRADSREINVELKP